MLMLLHTNPFFSELILKIVPRTAAVPSISKILEKYTSGWLTRTRLKTAIAPGTLPMITIAPIIDPDRPTPFGPMHVAEGQTEGNLITIDDKFFESYEDGAGGPRRHMAQTVLHELAHWGYRKGQQEGHPSDQYGRAHAGHGDETSPLDIEMFAVLDLINLMKRPRPLL